MRALGVLLSLIWCGMATGEQNAGVPRVTVIPAPEVCDVDSATWVMRPPLHMAPLNAELNGKGFGEFLKSWLANVSLNARDAAVPIASSVSSPEITLTLAGADSGLEKEAYTLVVNSNRIEIRASAQAGLIYGMETLRQLINGAERNTDGDRIMPALRITDKPRFQWRGLMLDCSRTFLSLDYLTQYVDLLTYYKMNMLHLHLTDNQGWRIQIDKHPRLTEVGSKFDSRFKDEVGGFYTKDGLRKLIRYAEARNVTIVPEIEMPSHAVAALAVYPDLACQPNETYAIVPHLYRKNPVAGFPAPPRAPFCAGNERTFEVLSEVLDEVIDLFPSKYIHIGGDERRDGFWETCPKCQARIKSEGLKDSDELQSWFVKRIEKHINSKGRTLLGWDEILAGGLAPNATVMSWRGVDGGVTAARAGHDVVMSPKESVYFDYDYKRTPVQTTYDFEPIPDSLSSEQAKHVLGVEACMWTHIARTQADIDRMILPRLAAVAEVAWSPRSVRRWDSFRSRLATEYRNWDAMGRHYYRDDR